MKTNNIISTPDITGNIGSCTSQSVTADTGYSLWKYDYKTIVTNSCTGQVTSYDSWGLTIWSGAGLVLIFMVLWAIISVSKSTKTSIY